MERREQALSGESQDEDELDQLGARGGGLKGEECVDLHLAAGVLALQVRLVPVGVV